MLYVIKQFIECLVFEPEKKTNSLPKNQQKERVGWNLTGLSSSHKRDYFFRASRSSSGWIKAYFLPGTDSFDKIRSPTRTDGSPL
jgi:hypothetical protein